MYSGQKPVAFMKRLVELFTTPGDWIFDGTAEIGMLHYSFCVHVPCAIPYNVVNKRMRL